MTYVKTEIKCPKNRCKSNLTVKMNRFGQLFLGCDTFPKCNASRNLTSNEYAKYSTYFKSNLTP